ncbi:hypothetical protein ACBI99_44680 [Nonomuraea sp. ATR24]|uniref:hypothetical protein n=1 Tax=Nonomuraea sp. ATR24 TaxID=1676744 RepID=UPI0035BFFDF4
MQETPNDDVHDEAHDDVADDAHADVHDDVDDPQEAEGESWDAFWDEVLRVSPTVTIRGTRVRRPADLPISFDERLARASNGNDEQTFRMLLGELFGTDVLDTWVAAGMGSREFKTVLTWGVACGRGRPISFREAYERIEAREAADREATALGKAPEGPEDSESSTPTSEESAGTGRSSRRTSAASTSSSRKRSRA